MSQNTSEKNAMRILILAALVAALPATAQAYGTTSDGNGRPAIVRAEGRTPVAPQGRKLARGLASPARTRAKIILGVIGALALIAMMPDERKDSVRSPASGTVREKPAVLTQTRRRRHCFGLWLKMLHLSRSASRA